MSIILEPRALDGAQKRSVPASSTWPPKELPKRPMIKRERDWLYIRTEVGVPSPVRWKQIIEQVAAKHHVTVPEILSPQRNRLVVYARQEAFYRLKTETMMSLPEIGRRMGGKDHTTVLYGVRKHRERMEAWRG